MEKNDKQSIGLLVIAAVFVLLFSGMGVIMSIGSSYAQENLVCPNLFDPTNDPTAGKECKMDISTTKFTCEAGSEFIESSCYTPKVNLPTCSSGSQLTLVDVTPTYECRKPLLQTTDECDAGWTKSDDETYCKATPIAADTLQCDTTKGFMENDAVSPTDEKACVKPATATYGNCPTFATKDGDACYSTKVEFGSDIQTWDSDTEDYGIEKDDEDEETTNPKTSDLPIVFVCIAALGALGYGAYKYRKINTY